MNREERAALRNEFKQTKSKQLEDLLVLESTPVHLYSTGSYAFDRAIKGIPSGRFIGIYGKQSCYKTSGVLRILGEVNKTNWDTGEVDENYTNPCGAMFIDLEDSFCKSWSKKVGFDEDLDENDVIKVVGGENVGDMVKDAIDSDMYSAIVIDSFESMMPLKFADESLETNEQGRRAQLLAKCFRKWIPAIVKSSSRNRGTPWRTPAIIYLNHAQEKMMTLHYEIVVPGGNSQRMYASMEIIMSKIAYNNESKKDFGLGTVKGTVDKNKVTGPRGKIFTYETALKDLDNLSAGQIDNAKSILKDIKDFEVMTKVKEGYEIFGEIYRTQADFKQKIYEDPDFEREVWDKMIKIVNQ